MLFVIVACFLALFSAGVTAQSDSFTSSLAARQVNIPVTVTCNATCTKYKEMRVHCAGVPHCGCRVPFLQVQGDCLVCQTRTPQDQAAVQFLLDSEISQCQSKGIKVDYQLDLPPAAAAIVQKFDRDSASLRRSQTAFLALQIAGGHVGLIIVLAFAVFSQKVRRDPTFLNFCITWIFSSVVYSLLLYRGTAGNNIANSLAEVPPNTCLAQAALTEGAQVMTACSTLALVVQLWLGLRAAVRSDLTRGTNQSRWVTYTLLGMPYVFFMAFALPTVFVGMDHIVVQGATLERVIPTNFYCAVIELNPFLRAVYGVTLALLLITVIFDVLIIRVLYMHWWSFRHANTQSAVSLSILLRVMVFSVYRVVVAAAYGTVINKPPVVDSAGQGASLAIIFSIPIWVDMLQAAIPLIACFVLGVNGDLICGLMFWRKVRSSKSSTSQSVNISTIGTMDSAWNEKAILEADTKFVTINL